MLRIQTEKREQTWASCTNLGSQVSLSLLEYRGLHRWSTQQNSKTKKIERSAGTKKLTEHGSTRLNLNQTPREL